MALTGPLLEAVRQLDRLVQAWDEGLFAFDHEYRIIHWNRTMERTFDLAAEEVLGTRVMDAVPSLADGGEDAVRAALAGVTTRIEDRPYVLPESGRQGYFAAAFAPLVVEGEHIVGGAAIVRDTSRKKAAERLMQETENRFRNMADASPVLLWMSGADTLCTFFNQTWLDFTGRTLEEEWGVGWAEGVHPEDFERCMDTYFEAFNARRPFEMEYRLRRHDGEYRWLLDRGATRYDPDGTFAGYVGSCVDITEHKRLEKALKEAVDARGEFLSLAAHELRTPLTPILLTAQLIQRRASDPKSPLHPMLPEFEGLVRQVKSQTELVETLLDVSRIEAGILQQPVLEDMNLVEVVWDLVNVLADQARRQGCEIRVLSDGPVHGRWDTGSIGHALRNLLSNACKYGQGKPVDVAVEDGDPVRIVVTDRGIGIPPEHQERIFARFERAVSVRQFGGFGLGLWIARNMVERMGGAIRVQSRPGEGSVFTLELPRHPGSGEGETDGARAAAGGNQREEEL